MNDCLPKFNTENFVGSQFILIGTNGPTKKESFFALSSGGCFTKVATYSKSYWKHRNTYRQYLLTKLSVKIKRGKFPKTNVVLLRWKIQRYLSIYLSIYIYIYIYRALTPPQTFPVNPPKKHKYLHINLGKNHAYAQKNNQSNKWLWEC